MTHTWPMQEEIRREVSRRIFLAPHMLERPYSDWQTALEMRIPRDVVVRKISYDQPIGPHKISWAAEVYIPGIAGIQTITADGDDFPADEIANKILLLVP
jgi:hypothetical protein